MALVAADWSVELVTGSLGKRGDDTHAPTFFARSAVQYLDYSDAARAFETGASAISAPVPMHPSFEDRVDAPDVLLAAVPPALVGIWLRCGSQPFVLLGQRRPTSSTSIT